MYILALQILVVVLCLSWVILGITLFLSGYQTYYKVGSFIKILGRDTKVHVDYISKEFLGETEGNGLRQILLGLCSIAAGFVFLLFLIFGGFLFG